MDGFHSIFWPEYFDQWLIMKWSWGPFHSNLITPHGFRWETLVLVYTNWLSLSVSCSEKAFSHDCVIRPPNKVDFLLIVQTKISQGLNNLSGVREGGDKSVPQLGKVGSGSIHLSGKGNLLCDMKYHSGVNQKKNYLYGRDSTLWFFGCKLATS